MYIEGEKQAIVFTPVRFRVAACVFEAGHDWQRLRHHLHARMGMPDLGAIGYRGGQ
jgi:hypothetical protein